MAISFSNQLFKNPFAQNSLSNLKPRIKSDKEEQTEQAKEKEEIQTEKTNQPKNTNKAESLQNNFANQILNNLLNFGLRNQNLETNTQNQFLQNNPQNKGTNNIESKNKDSLQKPAMPTMAEELWNALDKSGLQLSAASSVEIRESFTYTLSYNSKTGEFSESIEYSASLVANFNAEITDKNGNKVQVQNQIAIGKNFEQQLTGGSESLSLALKEFLEGQTFNAEFEGDLEEMDGDLESNGLSNALYFMETFGNSVRDAFKDARGENGLKDSNHQDILQFFDTIQKALQSSLDIFVGTPNQSNSLEKINEKNDKKESSNQLVLSMVNGDFTQSWSVRKLDNAEMFFGSSSLNFTALRIEA